MEDAVALRGWARRPHRRSNRPSESFKPAMACAGCWVKGSTSPLRRVGSLYAKGFRRYIRGWVDCRSVRSDLGAPGIWSAWWESDEQHHDLVHHWSDYSADRHRDCAIQLAETLVKITL